MCMHIHHHLPNRPPTAPSIPVRWCAGTAAARCRALRLPTHAHILMKRLVPMHTHRVAHTHATLPTLRAPKHPVALSSRPPVYAPVVDRRNRHRCRMSPPRCSQHVSPSPTCESAVVRSICIRRCPHGSVRSSSSSYRVSPYSHARKVCLHEAASKGCMMSTRVGRRHHCSHMYSTDLTVVPLPSALGRAHAHPPKTLLGAGRPAPRAHSRPPAAMGFGPTRRAAPHICVRANRTPPTIRMHGAYDCSRNAVSMVDFDWCTAPG